MKSAGGGDLSEVDTTAFLEQAAEYDGGGDLRDSVLKLRRLLWRTHPLPVARAAELRRWVDGGDYATILGGTYPRREDDSAASPSADAKAAADHYRAAFGATDDPLATMLRKLGEGSAGATEWATQRPRQDPRLDGQRRWRGPRPRRRRHATRTASERPTGRATDAPPTTPDRTGCERVPTTPRDHDPLAELEVVEAATARLLSSVQTLDAAALAAPSLLPGWTRGHVCSHVDRNADSLVNLLTSARTGVDIPQYASAEARDEGIEVGCHAHARGTPHRDQ